VIELNRSRNNVVLSRRAVLEDERKEMRQAILDRLSPGDVVEGQISNIVDFGAFVDLDGMDGLIHISELSWSHVNHPSEVLEIGQDVQVKVLDIDRDRQRISLGLKQTQSDPWQQVVEAYNEDDVVQGKVTKVVTFGAFVEIMPGVEGLVHISELAQHHVENPREVVSQGDVVNVKIIEVDADRRRLSLSLKRVDESDDVQPRADGQPLETPAPPQIDLSEDVFPEAEAQPEPPVRDSGPGEGASGEPGGSPEGEVEQRTGEEATDEALAETPVAESTPDIPAAEPEETSENEDTDASTEADAVDPTHQGPGDSEGHAPYAPEEAEEPKEQ
jgi:small subunit ribosomal protein S1